ncbi:hypothetical protein D3C71_1747380 [compost metagenome]
MKGLKLRIILGLLIVILIIPAAYGLEALDRNRGLRSGAIIKVQDESSGSLVALMGIDVLKSLMLQQFPDDDSAEGPTLLYVIGASGLSGYEQVEVKGLKGGEKFLGDKKDLSGPYVLALNERGTADLVELEKPEVILVRDVSEINKVQ